MADVKISDLTQGTPDASTTLLEASVLTNGSYGSASVTPRAVVDSTITELTDTLEAGETTIIFQSSAITANACLEFYTNVFGVVPKNVQAVAGVVTLTFDALSYDLGVKVRII